MMINAARIINRGILKISGSDRLTFLQGLVTNDIAQLTKDKSLYSLLLTSQGKHSFDLFLTAVGDEWWIEADRTRLDELKKRLSLYKLRSNITIDIDSEHHIFCLWGAEAANIFDLANDLGQTQHTPLWHAYVDPRCTELGVRLMINTDHLNGLQQCEDVIIREAEDYRYHRYGLGIPESNSDLLVDKSIPLENGMDELNAISWDKGCYMGQELTSRTRYRGLVRKRLFPVTINGSVDLEMPITADNVEIGQWRGVCQDRGLALIRLEAIDKPLMCGDAKISLSQPIWMKLPLGQ
jgi:folate-binding protein YgfZ